MSTKHSNQENVKYMTNKLPSLVLVGNSPNLIEKYNAGAEWQRLLKSLEEICAPYLGCTHRLRSFPLRMQAICNLYRLRSTMDSSENDPIVNGLHKWFEAVADLRPTPIHRMLVNMEFDYYLTTNYDYAFERALPSESASRQAPTPSKCIKLFSSSADSNKKVKKEENKVIHIHGRVDDIKDIVMLPRSYVNATKSLTEKEKPLWLEKFNESEVHICGLNLGPEETLVWYALESRLQHLLDQKRLISSYPRAYVYLFFNETDDKKDYYDKCAMRDLLRTYAVNTILIPVRNNDYIQAWKLLIGEMMLAKNGYRLQYEKNDQNDDEEDADKLNEELEKSLKKTEFGGGRLASLNSNMSTAFVSHYRYPYHCWISMSQTKAGLVKKSERWLCYCKVDSKRHMYWFSSTGSIKQYLEIDKNKKQQFLLNYYTGELYVIQNDGALKKLGYGNEIVDLNQFCRMIHMEPKKEASTASNNEKKRHGRISPGAGRRIPGWFV